MPAAHSRLHRAFSHAASRGRPALVGYLPAGFPTAPTSLSALRALAQHVDVIELGLPRWDKGTNALHRQAHEAATGSGATTAHALDVTRRLAALTPTPVLLNTPWATVARHGEASFAAAAAASGAAGVVLPHVHPTGPAATRWRRAAADLDLATVHVVQPEAMVAAARHSTGAVYLPTRLGEPTPSMGLLSRRSGQMRRHTRQPIIVGRGITTPRQAVALARHADALALGSVLLHAALTAPGGPHSAIDHLAARAALFAAATTHTERRRTEQGRAAA